MKRLLKNNAGATAIEYALLASLIGIAAVVGMQYVGQQVNMKFATVSNCLKSPSSGSCPEN